MCRYPEKILRRNMTGDSVPLVDDRLPHVTFESFSRSQRGGYTRPFLRPAEVTDRSHHEIHLKLTISPRATPVVGSQWLVEWYHKSLKGKPKANHSSNIIGNSHSKGASASTSESISAILTKYSRMVHDARLSPAPHPQKASNFPKTTRRMLKDRARTGLLSLQLTKRESDFDLEVTNSQLFVSSAHQYGKRALKALVSRKTLHRCADDLQRRKSRPIYRGEIPARNQPGTQLSEEKHGNKSDDGDDNFMHLVIGNPY
ncbi:uncharacterized protein BCR38DRAFT_405551 [Pseudomassariella vexata]|uniref:Uncharacterized protein n=1 Tax=Pseudomassariella vexata TaxID=1141098 RepID=A0A1Y2EGG5_9PEZI|nr:uncharacterized protein BCR38DRAFT_405551 [Pseudomassariella vexata]ORY69885.1 hypothetical protein BCR38DRAFT_405551 [Pseudomassariella vexata]